ncbi:unnamed protein product [Hymenolepis diminuta]|nr:unnamed protein product [Hymenolepis diminuta]
MAEIGNTRLDLTSTGSERKSLEIEIDAKNINDSTGSTPSTGDPKKISPTSLNSPSWLSVASDKSRTSQEHMTTNDGRESEPSVNSSSGQMDFFTGSVKRSTTGIFVCHICSYTGESRSAFEEHLRNHYPYHCEFCDYTSRTEGRLRHHIEAFHSETQPKNFSGKSVKRSSKSVRTFKCRDCSFSTHDKLELWTHLKQHLKPQRVLQCTLCPFVTEYAHHFDYHMKNHLGEKPFKCDKCNYVCVNKSMLNSHSKSHSNIYQYRCSECKYAAKYLHSLKQHLRKHKHGRPVVMNIDGSLPDNMNSLAVQPLEGTQETHPFSLLSPSLPFSPLSFNPSSMPLVSEGQIKLIETLIRPSLGTGFAPGIMSVFPQSHLTVPPISTQTSLGTDFAPGTMPVFPQPQPQRVPSVSTQPDEAPLDLSAPKKMIIKTEESDSVKNGEFGCNFCSVRFPDSQSASNHQTAHDPSDPTLCKSSEIRCTPPTSLYDHVKESRGCSE